MENNKKRMVVISDLHCGHRVGLTPPKWQQNDDNKYAKVQKSVWKFFTEQLEKIKPIDIVVINGDAIDGQGKKSGGTEHITTDRNEQVDMANECIQQIGAPKIYMTYGTGYHTGNEEDFESILATQISSRIKSHLQLDVNGLIFDFKHKVGSSTVPYSRATAIGKEQIWNLVWAESKGMPISDVIVRSHVHYYDLSKRNGKTMVTTPALQGYGSKYGSRLCSGTIDIGFLSFDVTDRDDWEMTEHLVDLSVTSEWLKDNVLTA